MLVDEVDDERLLRLPPLPVDVDVINNSWGCATTADGEDCDDDDLDQFDTVIDNLTAAGVLVVASAGNSGAQGCSSINTPAAMSQNALVVGNTTSSDAIAGSSSRGPVTRAGRNLLKPDIAAPGSSVCSAIPGTGYTTMSGTSMAGPHVAGLAALVMSAAPSLKRQPLVVKQIIMDSALSLTSGQTCGGYAGGAIPTRLRDLLQPGQGLTAGRRRRVDRAKAR